MKPNQLFKTEASHKFPTARVADGLILADPCYLVPSRDWAGWLDAFYAAGGKNAERNEMILMEFKGVQFQAWSTGGDGVIDGVAVDSGTLCTASKDEAVRAFGIKLIPFEMASAI